VATFPKIRVSGVKTFGSHGRVVLCICYYRWCYITNDRSGAPNGSRVHCKLGLTVGKLRTDGRIRVVIRRRNLGFGSIFRWTLFQQLSNPNPNHNSLAFKLWYLASSYTMSPWAPFIGTASIGIVLLPAIFACSVFWPVCYFWSTEIGAFVLCACSVRRFYSRRHACCLLFYFCTTRRSRCRVLSGVARFADDMT